MKIVILSCLVFSIVLNHYHVYGKKKVITIAVTEPATAIIRNLHCRMQKDRVFLDWTINNNQLVSQIEVESSTDGQNYAMAALIFSTEKNGSDAYNFFEKAKAARIFYRLKIVQKDQEIRYSDIVSAA
jgi:hypothetical protein